MITPVAASVFFILLYTTFANVEFYYEKKYFIMVSSVIAAIANVVLNLWLIPIFGYLVAAYTTLFSYILYSLAHYVFVRITIKDIPNHEKVFNIKLIVLLFVKLVLISLLVLMIYDFLVIRLGLIILIAFITLILVFAKSDDIRSYLDLLVKIN